MDIKHLNVMVEIIDACAERGAFKGTELYSVGALRNIIIQNIEQPENVEEAETEENPET